MVKIDPETDQSFILKNIKVIELGHFIAAPMVGMMLAENGAEVIQIIDPNTISYDPLLDAMLARSKHQIKLDLKQTANVDLLKDLLTQADIVIENFAPHAFKNLGIDFNQIRRDANPRLISCSIPAFLKTDARSSIPGYECIAGMAGLSYERPLSPPVYHNFPIGSVMAAVYSATAIVAALIARNRDGIGQHIDVSLFESNLFAQMLQIMAMNGAPRSFMPLKMIATPFMGVWQCADKNFVYLHITLPAHNAKMLEYFENNGYEAEITELKRVLSPETVKDPSLLSSVDEANKVKVILRKIFATKLAIEWEKLLGDEFCCIKVRNLEEWVHEAEQSQMDDCVIVEDPEFGSLYTYGPVIYSNTRSTNIAPRQCNQEPLEDLLTRWKSENVEFSDQIPDLLRKINETTSTTNKAPLEGIRVVDMARIIAGPFAARILHELGSEVVSIQSPTNLEWALSFHCIMNVGKKSVTLDITNEEGKQRLWDLLDAIQPNIFVQNYRNLDLAHDIGIDYEHMQAHFPQIVYTHLNAYGVNGAWQNRPAFEQVVQALTGLQLEYNKGGKPKIFPMSILDFGSGLLGAFASVMGLYQQQKTGKSAFFNTHMTTFALLIQAIGFSHFQQQALTLSPQNNQKSEEISPQKKLYQGMFECLDKFICIAGDIEDITKWFHHSGLISKSNEPFEDQIAEAKKRFKRGPVIFWKLSLQMAGLSSKVGLIIHHKVNHLFSDLSRNNKGLSSIAYKMRYPGLGLLSFVRTPIHFSSTPIVDVEPAPIRGTNTKEFLAKIGIDIPDGTGLLPYPANKPLFSWLWNFAVWGIYALRSGNM